MEYLTTLSYLGEFLLTGEKDELPSLLTWDDAGWILNCVFVIFTMQSGFGLLEAGCVSVKNEVNIMVKNSVDVIFGGLSYWMFGYGLSFGNDALSNAFVGIGSFFVDTSDNDTMGLIFSNFVFQLSFATTATTIVSGAMAERTKLTAYIIFSFFNTIVYCVPAHWIWAENGFLRVMGVVDIAGSGAVHLLGGVSALVGALLLGPRMNRYDDKNHQPVLGNPTNALIGMFMLWWGWLGFNCGSTFGIAYGKWKLASKAAVTTLNASMGGGVVGLGFSYIYRGRKYIISDLVNSVLGALVAITAGCAVVRPWEAIIIGIIGGFISTVSPALFDKLRIDDPVGAISVHGISGMWGMLAVGLFLEDEPVQGLNNGQVGLFKGGGARSLGVQLLACVAIIAWSALTTFIILICLKFTCGLRMSEEEETLGADLVEHGIDPLQHLFVENNTSNCNNLIVRRGSLGFRSGADILNSPSKTRMRNSIGVIHENSLDQVIPENSLDQVIIDKTVTENGNGTLTRRPLSFKENSPISTIASQTIPECTATENTNGDVTYVTPVRDNLAFDNDSVNINSQL